jgi:hypothetical protein
VTASARRRLYVRCASPLSVRASLTRRLGDGGPFGRPIRYLASTCQYDPRDPTKESQEPLAIRDAPSTDAPVVGTPPLGTHVEGWPMGWWLELEPSFEARPLHPDGPLVHSRFMQILETGPDCMGPAGDEGFDEWCFLHEECVSSATTRHYLDQCGDTTSSVGGGQGDTLTSQTAQMTTCSTAPFTVSLLTRSTRCAPAAPACRTSPTRLQAPP